ncbi:MAG TPA: DNA-3-methyladenine glycosylase [bacterium]|jgi:DNA-3-methyladenine glycosylase|nr:DNA-3-methyladenine glycosylase [bacterium]
MILSPSFYQGSTIKVAKALVGQILVHETPQGLSSGRIVEVEAYLPKNDPGCHAARGKTPRNAVMFGPPGHAYVYFCYGNHFMFNIVTEKEGVPGAVLIRALEPVKGLDLMVRRRGKFDSHELGLTNGPGKLVQALGINRQHNQIPVFKRPLCLLAGDRKEKVGVTTRIGLTEGAELPLRFYLEGNRYVSVKPGTDRFSQGMRKKLKALALKKVI